MFVKKFAEKALLSSKKTAGGGLHSDDVDPRIVFHYGIPFGSTSFAYDPIQNILAITTKDGRIKLFGKDNTQALLQNGEPISTKFFQFMHNKPVLLNVTSDNHIQVWDVDKKQLSRVHVIADHEITSFQVLQQTPFIYVGDSAGNVSVLKLDEESCNILQMKYTIPFSASHGNSTEGDAVMHLLPQPSAESKRVLVIFRDGQITLWDIKESKSIFTTGGNLLQSIIYQEAKKVTCACWVCPFGKRVAVGYSNGEIFIWSIPPNESGMSAPICKLNIGYKSEKTPIASLKWAYADGKASRLYVMGASSDSVQVVLLNEQTESRTIKLALHLSEPCIDMETTSSCSEQSKHKQDSFLILGKSGHIYAYDDNAIEKYLLQNQYRSPLSLPKEIALKIPFFDASVTVAKFVTDHPHMPNYSDEDYITQSKCTASILPTETKVKEGNHFSGFSKIRNLYVTGHSDGAINFWDATCPFLIPVLSLKQQSEDDLSLSGIPLTALYFDGNSRLLVSGDQNGMVRIFKFKSEPYATENSFMSFQGSAKKVIQSMKLIKVNSCVLSLSVSHGSKHLAVGSDQGYVSVIDMEEATLLYEKHIASEISAGIVSLQFETCSLHGFDKNVLVIATKDSSVSALESDTGNMLNTSMVHPKKQYKALFMQVLSSRTDSPGSGKGNPAEAFILLCSEKAAYIYSLTHAVQGVKKVQCKKNFQSCCCWASTFYSASDVGLVLVLTNGKVEIRSLPDLSLLKETTMSGFAYSTPKPNSFSDTVICTSWDGQLLLVNGDQEIFSVSLLLQKERFRLLDFVSQVYRKDLIPWQDVHEVPKEKKKGIFSSVLKSSSKSKQNPDVDIEDTRHSFEQLLTFFSTPNFATGVKNEEETELDIDDIDIGDFEENPKEHNNMLAGLNRQKLTSTFQAFKGKLKAKKVKNEKSDEQEDKANSVDQIKKKYGFTLSGESSVAKMAESKLQENLKKLQGISLKTTDMEDSAKSFANMAKQVLRGVEQQKQSSSS